MLRYEILMLADPNITDEQASNLEKQVSDLIAKSKGKVLSFEKWGKIRLSYPVKKHEYGVYFLSRYELSSDMAPEALSELQLFFRIKVNDLVLRSTCKKLGKGASLEYIKPEGLGDDERVARKKEEAFDETEG